MEVLACFLACLPLAPPGIDAEGQENRVRNNKTIQDEA